MNGPIPELDGNPFRLGRHVNHDARSRSYRVAPVAAPVSVSWTRRVPIFDQGDLGSCTGNAAAGWLGTDNALRSGLVQITAPSKSYMVNEALAVEIYHEATALDPYPGTYPPTDTGSDGLSVAKVLKNLGQVDTYLHAFSFDDFLSAMQTGPVMLGTNWYDGMFNPDSNGVVTISGSVAGGHEYVCVAVDVTKQTGTFSNSWGTGWGKAGYFTMSFATIKRLLSEDGDCTAPHALVVAPTPPAPPTPTPDAWDELCTWLRDWWKRHFG